ncbi:MAG: potassium-transporting ATPase [Mycobacterium sp.]
MSVISVAIYVALTVAVFALLGAVQKWVETL